MKAKPENLDPTIATHLQRAESVTNASMRTAVEAVFKRLAPELIKMADHDDNPFKGGGFKVEQNWLKFDADGGLKRMYPEKIDNPAPIPGDSRADIAPELQDLKGVVEAAEAGPGAHHDPKIRATLMNLAKAMEGHGFRLDGISRAGLDDPTPVIIYSSSRTARVPLPPPIKIDYVD
jgi:hypothetical protein